MSEITLEEFADRIQEVGESEFKRRMKVQLAATSMEIVRQAKINATTKPRVRSGRLRSSIRSRVQDSQIILQAGGNTSGGQVTYAATQEFGATIRPRVADYLRIPLGPSLTGAGDERFGGSLRNYPGEGFYVFRSGRGNLLIGKRGEAAPWYALVKQVTVPRTLFLGRAVEMAAGKMRPQLQDLFRVALSGGTPS